LNMMESEREVTVQFSPSDREVLRLLKKRR